MCASGGHTVRHQVLFMDGQALDWHTIRLQVPCTDGHTQDGHTVRLQILVTDGHDLEGLPSVYKYLSRMALT
jgi:hypothetical protein